MSESDSTKDSVEDLLHVVTDSVQVLRVSASYGRLEGDADSEGVEFEVDVMDSGMREPFIGSSLSVVNESGSVSVLVASRIIFPRDVGSPGNASFEDVASALRKRAIAVHTLYDSAANAARAAMSSFAVDLVVPRDTPDPVVSILSKRPSDEGPDE